MKLENVIRALTIFASLATLAFLGWHYVLAPRLEQAEIKPFETANPVQELSVQRESSRSAETPAPVADVATADETPADPIAPESKTEAAEQLDEAKAAIQEKMDTPAYREMVAAENAKMLADMAIGSAVEIELKEYVHDICSQSHNNYGARTNSTTANCYSMVIFGNENFKWRSYRSHAPDTSFHIFSRNPMIKDNSIFNVLTRFDCYRKDLLVGWTFLTPDRDSVRFIDEPDGAFINIGLLFGNGSREVLTTKIVNSGRAVVIADEAQIPSFMGKLENNTLLQVTFPGVYPGRDSVIFDIGGFEKIAPRLRETCGL